MPAVPGAKRNQEKQKKKREAARKARLDANARAKARAPQVPVEEPVDPNAPPSPYEAVRTQDFDDLDELAADVAALLKKKKIDDAARKCAEIVRRFPNEPDGWQGFAKVYEARGDLPRAISEMERAAQRASAEDAGTVAAIQKELQRMRAALAKRG